MRSLFVDDIPGAKPKKHSFDKAIYRERHQQEILRYSNINPQQKRIIQWYQPSKKTTQPMDRLDNEYWRTKQTLKKSPTTHQPKTLSKSLILSPTTNPSASPILNNSSILSGSGKNSLMNSSMPQDPYFPHRYGEYGQTSKWSGFRGWQPEPNKIINLPSVENVYFRKW